MKYKSVHLSGITEVYVYRTYITVGGRKLYARDYGKRAFRIPVKVKTR